MIRRWAHNNFVLTDARDVPRHWGTVGPLCEAGIHLEPSVDLRRPMGSIRENAGKHCPPLLPKLLSLVRHERPGQGLLSIKRPSEVQHRRSYWGQSVAGFKIKKYQVWSHMACKTSSFPPYLQHPGSLQAPEAVSRSKVRISTNWEHHPVFPSVFRTLVPNAMSSDFFAPESTRGR